jgi:hypothetical protein
MTTCPAALFDTPEMATFISSPAFQSYLIMTVLFPEARTVLFF